MRWFQIGEVFKHCIKKKGEKGRRGSELALVDRYQRCVLLVGDVVVCRCSELQMEDREGGREPGVERFFIIILMLAIGKSMSCSWTFVDFGLFTRLIRLLPMSGITRPTASMVVEVMTKALWVRTGRFFAKLVRIFEGMVGKREYGRRGINAHCKRIDEII